MTPAEINYEVVRLELDDLTALQNFYKNYFQDKAVLNNQTLWHWSFMQNPFRENIPFFVIKAGDKIVGAIGYLSVQFQIGSNFHSGGHPVNFFIDPKYKGLPALKLFRKVLNERDILYASYLSEDASKLLKASGFIDLSEKLADYYYPLELSPIEKSTNFVATLKTVAIYSIRSAWLYVVKIFCLLNGSSVSFKVEKFLDERLIPIREPDADRIGIVKNKSYLKWRYVESPTLNCVYFYAFKNNIPSGLAIIHIEKNKAILLDLISKHNESVFFICVINRIISFCKAENLQFLTTVLLNKKVEKILSVFGFSKNRSSYGLMAFTKDKSRKLKLMDVEKWDFIAGNTDIF